MYRIGLATLIIFMLSACKIKEHKARNYYLDNPEKLAKLSDMVFPIRGEYKQGEEIKMTPDTMYLQSDTVIVQADCPDGTKVSVKCPPCDTVKIYVPVLRIDTAVKYDDRASAGLRIEMAKIEKSNIELRVKLELTERESKNKTWWIVGLSLLSALSFAGLVYKSISGSPTNLLSKILKK